jgi:hypothetical protein
MQKHSFRIYLVPLALALGALSTEGHAQTTRTSEEPHAAQPLAGASAPASPNSVKQPLHKGSAKWWGADATPGWELMTWKERNEHRKKMRSMKNYEDCKSYLAQHHEKMAERSKTRGTPMHEPKHDSCAGLKP